ncbi:MAG: hypothetical protein AMJ79_12565 [Phycisphaerae bacterium SM23_30]|nr:MAG: hypothetical protein AMJ79_12565 [Phycisphaerae bacterium SM23_30]
MIGIQIAADSGVEPEPLEEGEEEPLIPEQPFDLVRVSGGLGETKSTTGQMIETLVMVEAGTIASNPMGPQRQGLYSETGINKITVLHGLGDVHVTGDVLQIIINSDGKEELGEYEGLCGNIVIGGSLGKVELGSGMKPPGTGEWPEAGLFVTGTLQRVEVRGPGHDIEGVILSQTEIGRISVTNGARLVGSTQASRISLGVSESFGDYRETGEVTLAGPIGKVEVKGEGSEIYGSNIVASVIETIEVNGGAEGIFYATIWGGQTLETVEPNNGYIKQITVGGEGIHDTLIFARRHVENLKVLKGGSIEDSIILVGHYLDKVIADEFNEVEIDVANWINQVTARESMHELTLNAAELGRLRAKKGITGASIEISGPVGLIQTKGDLLGTIEVAGPYGDLRKLQVGGDLGTAGGGKILVDGQVGSIKVGGDFLGEFLLNWGADEEDSEGGEAKFYHEGVELKSLKVGGKIEGLAGIGGDVGLIKAQGEFGRMGSEFIVDGNLKRLVIGSRKNPSDLDSAMTVRNNLGKATIYGSVNGDIKVAGDLNTLSLRGSDDYRADLNASVLVGGEFNKMVIIDGDVSQYSVVDGAPVVIETAPKKYIERGSDISGKVVNHMLGADLEIDGSITSTGRWISSVDAGTLHIGGDIEAGGLVEITGDLRQLIVEGGIWGTVHVSGDIGLIETSNIIGGESIITAGGNIGEILVGGRIEDSYVLSGFDPGLVLLSDGSVMTVSEQITQGAAGYGDINLVQVGILANSVIGAGVSPGSNGVFGDMDGSDVPGSGQSIIKKVRIGSIEGQGIPFGVFADKEIGSLKVGGRRLPTPVSQIDGFRSWTIDIPSPGGIGGFVFQSGLPFQGTINGTRVTVSMSGSGMGELLPGPDQIETIQLRGTTDKTKIKVTAAGGATIDVGQLYTGDDEALGQLIIDGRLANAESNASIEIGGQLEVLKIRGLGAGSEIYIGGGVSRAGLGLVGGTEGYASEISIRGVLDDFEAQALTSYTSVTAEQIDRAMIKGDMDGTLSSLKGGIGKVVVKGDMGGIISSAEDIDQIKVKGEISVESRGGELRGIRAGRDIGKVWALRLNTSVVAAGRELGRVKIKQDVSFSTLASGLDIGGAGILFDGMETAGAGDIRQVKIGGDFIQSNLIAAIAPGPDRMFGTADDEVKEKAVEEADPPRVSGVRFEGKQLNAIVVEFEDKPQDLLGNIHKVMIKGEVEGSEAPYPWQQFAIAAAGKVYSVKANRQAFTGQSNVLRMEINRQNIEASTIEASDITAANAADQAFQVISDGLDHVFGTDDDVIIGGDDDPNTTPTVYVSYDPQANEARFHNKEGFLANRWGTNYFKVMLDGSKITNGHGAPLEGGEVFEQIFAVGDLGDMVATAFEPFWPPGEFPDNIRWSFASQVGDNLQYSTNDAWYDQDFIRLNQLHKGENIAVTVESKVDGEFTVLLWRLEETSLEDAVYYVIEFLGREDIIDDPDITVPVDLVVPELDEVAYAEGRYYLYENIGQTFYSLERATYSIEPLDNTLDDINSLVANEGIIIDVNGLAGHSFDSLWALADFKPNIAGSVPRQSLLLITNISRDVNDIDPVQVQLAESNVKELYTDIVGLAEAEGVLYGVDAASKTLITLDSDPESADFGEILSVQSLSAAEGEDLFIDELYLSGLSIDLEGEGLLLLHDQPEDEYDSFMVDALYRLDPNTGQISLFKEFALEDERHGLATEPEGAIIAGLPMRGSPMGDVVKVTFGQLGTVSHTFGGSSSVFPGGVNKVSSDVLTVPENARQSDFVKAGFHYAFDITYATGPQYGKTTVTMSDIDWLDEGDSWGMISLATDDPVNTTASLITEFSPQGEVEYSIEVKINAVNGDGDVRVYFAQTSEVEVLEPVELSIGGSLMGEEGRSDMTPERDFILPELDEITTNTANVEVGWELDLTEELEDQLAAVLDSEMMDRLQEEVTEELLSEIVLELLLLGEDELLEDFLEAISSLRAIYYDGVGYDAEQEIFALISTSTYDTAPILVNDPFDPQGDDVVLTRQVLSDILDQSIPGVEISIDDIGGLEFGDFGQLYSVVTVRERNLSTGMTVTRDSLLIIEDITEPITGMTLSTNPMNIIVEGVTYDMHLTSLAYDNGMNSQQIDNKLYGLEEATQTLVIVETRELLPDGYGNLVKNDRFGMLSLPGGGLSNLGDPGGSTFGLKQIDFDLDGRLYGLGENTYTRDESYYYLAQISTDSFLDKADERLELVMELPEGEEYNDFNFDVSGFGGFLPGGLFSEEVSFHLVKSVSGNPLGQEVQIRVNGGVWEEHTFGSEESTIGSVTISSMEINSETGLSYNEASEVRAAGGYYRFDVSYETGQGEIMLSIRDIDWPTGSIGDIDSVFVSDGVNTAVETFGEKTLSLRIDSDLGDGELAVYFGATCDLLFASTAQSMTSLAGSVIGIGGASAVMQVPESGNYVLQINGTTPAAYEVSIEAISDGNSDFGIRQTESGYRYDPISPNERPVNLGPPARGNEDLAVDEDDPELFYYNPDLVDPITEARQARWFQVEGTLLAPGQASELKIHTELSNMMDVDIFSFELVEGQYVTVDLDAGPFFGGDDVELSVGIYNADLEALATTVMEEDDTLPAVQRVDPIYTVQAIHQMPHHEGPDEPILDPMSYDESLDAEVGTYYVVVTAELPSSGIFKWTDSISYRLTISTTEAEPVEAPPSQLVWLAFGDPETGVNARADHIVRQLSEGGGN